mmetsp:Transcript_2184/g.6361  ORF Transcript_2184/g.6361 Transcript_2184/m.6361 type:complete len:232 (+) Transcript_2184:273-968(+)
MVRRRALSSVSSSASSPLSARRGAGAALSSPMSDVSSMDESTISVDTWLASSPSLPGTMEEKSMAGFVTAPRSLATSAASTSSSLMSSSSSSSSSSLLRIFLAATTMAVKTNRVPPPITTRNGRPREGSSDPAGSESSPVGLNVMVLDSTSCGMRSGRTGLWRSWREEGPSLPSSSVYGRPTVGAVGVISVMGVLVSTALSEASTGCTFCSCLIESSDLLPFVAAAALWRR